jgi:hypothetical protein
LLSLGKRDDYDNLLVDSAAKEEIESQYDNGKDPQRGTQ